MMDEKQFGELVDEIMGLGYGEDQAAQYAAMIGDRPARDQDGFIVVKKSGRLLARFKLKFFGDGESKAEGTR